MSLLKLKSARTIVMLAIDQPPNVSAIKNNWMNYHSWVPNAQKTAQDIVQATNGTNAEATSLQVGVTASTTAQQ